MDRILAVNGIDMHVEISGEGETLLLLHGGGGAGVNWQLIFREPPKGYKTITPDVRGHGRTTGSARGITFSQIASDVIRLLDTLGINRFKAIGLSMGAKTLLHLATQWPERVTDMVLVSATPYFPEATRTIMRAAASATHSDEEWEQMRRWHAHGDNQIKSIWEMTGQLANDYQDMRFTPLSLGGIQARTLIVHGDSDPLYPVELAQQLHAGIPHSYLWIIPHGGHCPVFGDTAELFANKAVSFLNDEWT